jgi:hypothetical protein
VAPHRRHVGSDRVGLLPWFVPWGEVMQQQALPLSVSRLVLQAKQQEIDAVRQLAGRAEFVDVIGQLIHALQRERGASSTYLASKGQRFADVRRAALEEARPVEAELRVQFAVQMDPPRAASARMLSMMAWVQLGLDALDELRSQIEQQALTAHDSVAAFSRVIASLVELIFEVADAAPLPGISRLLVAYLHLVQGKEAAGQERAIGALQFASGSSSEAHQQRVIHLIDAQERSLSVFAEFAEASQRAHWEQQQLAPGVARLERLRRTLCTARPGATLDSNLSDGWFDVCSERITALWQLEIDLVKRLREACGRRSANRSRTCWIPRACCAACATTRRHTPMPSIDFSTSPPDPNPHRRWWHRAVAARPPRWSNCCRPSRRDWPAWKRSWMRRGVRCTSARSSNGPKAC